LPTEIRLNSIVKSNQGKLKCTLLSERSQAEKGVHYMIPTIQHCGKLKTVEVIKRSVVSRGEEGKRHE
jgi:hypothetical protein